VAIPPEKLIVSRFTKYRSYLSDIWCSYCLIDHYLPEVHENLKHGILQPFSHISYAKGSQQPHSLVDTYGLISHTLSKVNPRRALIDAVSFTEDYLQYLTTIVYRTFPGKLAGSDIESTDRIDKIIDVILKSDDKEEMIDRLVEEKVRNIFYGNASLFFLKDRARLGFKDYFFSHHQVATANYMEILAYRNALIHSDSRVDRKFLKEAPNSKLLLGQKIKITSAFLAKSLITLRGLSANATFLVLQNSLGVTPFNRKLLAIRKSFNQEHETNS